MEGSGQKVELVMGMHLILKKIAKEWLGNDWQLLKEYRMQHCVQHTELFLLFHQFLQNNRLDQLQA
jgi:hypothetical protein